MRRRIILFCADGITLKSVFCFLSSGVLRPGSGATGIGESAAEGTLRLRPAIEAAAGAIETAGAAAAGAGAGAGAAAGAIAGATGGGGAAGAAAGATVQPIAVRSWSAIIGSGVQALAMMPIN